MAKRFLGSVGTVEAFRKDASTGKMVLAFRSKTLTDSGINISTTKDDNRAGTGAPIQFSFYHDPSVEITLTDVIFDEAYVEAQLGAHFERGTSDPVYYSEPTPLSASGGSVTLTKDPQSISICGSEDTPVWYAKKGSNEWKTIDGTSVTLAGKAVSGLPEDGDYCFRYLVNDPNAAIADITSEIIPEELFLVVSAPVFNGDSCSASNGKRAGTITYEIPRFKLNGSQDFAMNMSSNQTMSLAGVALASEDGCDINKSNLLRVILQLDDEFWYTGVQELIADEDYLQVGKVPHIYARYANGTINLIGNSLLGFYSDSAYTTPVTITDGKWTASDTVYIRALRQEGDTTSSALPTEQVVVAA